MTMTNAEAAQKNANVAAQDIRDLAKAAAAVGGIPQAEAMYRLQMAQAVATLSISQSLLEISGALITIARNLDTGTGTGTGTQSVRAALTSLTRDDRYTSRGH